MSALRKEGLSVSPLFFAATDPPEANVKKHEDQLEHERMLAEVTKVRQIPGEPERRWFSDDLLDLFVWFSKEGAIIGFQLCYDKGHKEKALTWTSDRGFSHLKVDSGDAGWSRMTPILVPDGIIDTGRVLAEFKRASRNIEAGIADFVIARLGEYGGTVGTAR